MKSILALMLSAAVCAHAAELRPNILLIYADDIGYGDLGCYGAEKVKTPNCDKLAAAGIRFTDGHSVASVCTPSRYAMLTGDYAFRKKGTNIASGVDGLLIGTERTTLPLVLKDTGYTTGVIGKWHLGLGTTPTDYNQTIKPGPCEIGSWKLLPNGGRQAANGPALYNLAEDLSESNNLVGAHPERVAAMMAKLTEITGGQGTAVRPSGTQKYGDRREKKAK